MFTPRGASPLSVSALPYTTSDLDLNSVEDAQFVASHHATRKREIQKHAAELTERDVITLNIDRASQESNHVRQCLPDACTQRGAK